jgi:DNA repair ATPase RecN
MTTTDPRSTSAAASPSSPHHIIRTLAVSDGFLKGAAFDFVDGLNVIIGVRGSGKSTSLSFIRYVLDNAAAARSNALRLLVKENLCGGRIQLGVSTKYGVSYTGERRFDEPLAVLDAQGAACNVSLDRDGVFGADIYSHNELEEIAKTPRLQLDLIDRFIDVDVRRIAVEARRVEHELHGTATELQRLTEEERELNDRTSEVAALEAKLAALRPTGGADGDALVRAHAAHALRAREVRAIEELETGAAAIRKESAGVAESLRRKLGAKLDAELTAGPNGATMKAVDARVQTARERIDALLAEASGQCERMLTDRGPREPPRRRRPRSHRR